MFAEYHFLQFLIVCLLNSFLASELIEYHRGDPESKIIISVPHGGTYEPDYLADRRYGCLTPDGQCIWRHICTGNAIKSKKCKATTVTDVYTKEIARTLHNHILKLTGKSPYLIINNLLRTKMDPNRDIDQAAFGDSSAELVWKTYHCSIDDAKKAIGGPGILFDIHGKRRSGIELGYLIRGNTLDDKTIQINPNQTSIRSLSHRYPGIPFDDILRGQKSFGAFIKNIHYTNATYVVIPSPAHPGPRGKKFYSGAYITTRHGSLNGGKIDAIQIESPKSLRLLPQSKLQEYSRDLAEAVNKFVGEYYK